uniref:Uncharacterized protein n=1 Tax=Candidatus Kentrum sp. TC TaxID=2126339 RepID=A0A450Y8K4_9GAMM|nr:MAG: hypothetical protein BECKTC1821E_GA0114239_1001117 [Candidatus Kentron sp. TC]
MQAKGRLDDARDPGGGLQMTDVGLDAADPAGIVGIPLLSDDLAQGGAFLGVADGRAGAVGFDIGDLVRRDAGALAYPANQGGLGLFVGDGNAVGAPILIDAGSPYDGIDGVPIAPGGGEGFQHHDARPFAASVAVAPGVETLAAPVPSQELALAHGDDGFRVVHDVDAARQGKFRFPGADRLTGLMQRHQ